MVAPGTFAISVSRGSPVSSTPTARQAPSATRPTASCASAPERTTPTLTARPTVRMTRAAHRATRAPRCAARVIRTVGRAVSVCNLKGNARDRQCIPKDQIGEGKPYQCGDRGVVRNVCRPRKFCNTCETDADCLAVSNQVCAKDESGTKICTQLCDLKRPSCPWGNAAECGVWDTTLGAATCQHRFGSCKGSGKSCEPCLTDADCGEQGACNSSSFTGERWCVDFSVSCSCSDSGDDSSLCEGGGCPETPGGLAMLCSDSTPSTPNSGYCAGAYTSTGLGSSPQTGCWPAN
jgi:hypothetical protein